METLAVKTGRALGRLGIPPRELLAWFLAGVFAMAFAGLWWTSRPAESSTPAASLPAPPSFGPTLLYTGKVKASAQVAPDPKLPPIVVLTLDDGTRWVLKESTVSSRIPLMYETVEVLKPTVAISPEWPYEIRRKGDLMTISASSVVREK